MNRAIVGFLAARPRREILRPGRQVNRRYLAATSVSTATPMTVPDTVAPPPPSKPVNEVIAGATARAASQATIHPLDTLKVRMQTTMKNGKQVKGIGKNLPSISRCARGVSTLYKGVLSAATGAGIAIGAYFAFYSVAKNVMTRRTQLNPGAVAFVSGGAAALGSSVVKVPLAVCIRSVQAGVYPNAVIAAGSIVKAAGVRGLFTGYLPTMLEDVPDMAVKFAAYETLRSVHQSIITDRQPNTQEDFVMGAISGALAAACSTPLDVVKTNMMCMAASRPSMISVATKVMRTKGVTGFFQGVGPRALSNGMNSAVFFCFLEAFRTVIQKHMKSAAEA